MPTMEWADAHKLRDELREQYPFGTRVRLTKDGAMHILPNNDRSGMTGTIYSTSFIRRGPYVDGVALNVDWDNSDSRRTIIPGRDEFRLLNPDELKQEQELADFAKLAIENLKTENDSESIMLPCNIIGTSIKLTVTLLTISDDMEFDNITGNHKPIDPYNEYEFELKRINNKGKTSYRRTRIIVADEIIKDRVSEYDDTNDQRLLNKIQLFLGWYMRTTKLSKIHIYERTVT